MHTLAVAKYWQPLISLYISLFVLIYVFWFWVHSVCRFFLCAFTSLYVVLIFHNRKHIPVCDSLIMSRGTKVYRFSWHYSNDGFWVFMLHSVMGFSVLSEECEDGSNMFFCHVETKPILLHGVKTQNSIWVESYVMYVSKLLLLVSLKHIIRKWWCTISDWFVVSHCITYTTFQIITIAIHIPSLIIPLNYSFSMFHSTGGHQGVNNELIKEIMKVCIMLYVKILWDITICQSMYCELSFLLILFLYVYIHTYKHTHTHTQIYIYSNVQFC